MAEKVEHNYGFKIGDIPPGVTVENNVKLAKEYQKTHTLEETYKWFNTTVCNNADKHLPENLSMDYKQLKRGDYENVGNFNYALVGKPTALPTTSQRRQEWLTVLRNGWPHEKKNGNFYFKTVLKCSRCCWILLVLLVSMNMSSCVCFDIYSQQIDRSSLGNDIVSLNLKDGNLDGAHQRWVDLTNKFFASYRDKKDIVEYFESIGGECWDEEGENIGACRVIREAPLFTRKTICSKPKFQGMVVNALIYRFKKDDDRFSFDYEWDLEHSSPVKSGDW